MEKGLNKIIRQLQHDWNNQKVSKQTVLYTLKSFKRFELSGALRSDGLLRSLDSSYKTRMGPYLLQAGKQESPICIKYISFYLDRLLILLHITNQELNWNLSVSIGRME